LLYDLTFELEKSKYTFIFFLCCNFFVVVDDDDDDDDDDVSSLYLLLLHACFIYLFFSERDITTWTERHREAQTQLTAAQHELAAKDASLAHVRHLLEEQNVAMTSLLAERDRALPPPSVVPEISPSPMPLAELSPAPPVLAAAAAELSPAGPDALAMTAAAAAAAAAEAALVEVTRERDALRDNVRALAAQRDVLQRERDAAAAAAAATAAAAAAATAAAAAVHVSANVGAAPTTTMPTAPPPRNFSGELSAGALAPRFVPAFADDMVFNQSELSDNPTIYKPCLDPSGLVVKSFFFFFFFFFFLN
jgi:hypothetical protein